MTDEEQEGARFKYKSSRRIKKKKEDKVLRKTIWIGPKNEAKEPTFQVRKKVSLGKVTRKMTWKWACSFENFFTFWCQSNSRAKKKVKFKELLTKHGKEKTTSFVCQ